MPNEQSLKELRTLYEQRYHHLDTTSPDELKKDEILLSIAAQIDEILTAQQTEEERDRRLGKSKMMDEIQNSSPDPETTNNLKSAPEQYAATSSGYKAEEKQKQQIEKNTASITNQPQKTTSPSYTLHSVDSTLQIIKTFIEKHLETILSLKAIEEEHARGKIDTTPSIVNELAAYRIRMQEYTNALSEHMQHNMHELSSVESILRNADELAIDSTQDTALKKQMGALIEQQSNISALQESLDALMEHNIDQQISQDAAMARRLQDEEIQHALSNTTDATSTHAQRIIQERAAVARNQGSFLLP